MRTGKFYSGDGHRLLHRLSFRVRMVLYFGVIFALGLVGAVLSSLYGIPFTDFGGEYGMRRSEAFRGLNLVADTKKRELLRQIAERQGDAATFCDSPVVRDLVARASLSIRAAGSGNRVRELRSEESRLLEEHLRTVKQVYMMQYDGIMIADAATGIVFASTDGRDLGTDLSHDPGVAKVTEGLEDEVMSIRRDGTTGTSYLSIYHAIKRYGPGSSGEDEETAVLVMYLKPEMLIRSLAIGPMELGRTGEIYLVDQDGSLLTPLRHAPPEGNALLIATLPARLASEGNEGIVEAADHRNVSVLSAFRHLRLNSETGWGMVVTKERAEVFAPLRRLILYFAVTGISFSVLVLVLVWVVATRLSRPIVALSEAAKRVEGGDFTVCATSSDSSEIGMLSRAFNSMVEQIGNWRNVLEWEVKARTTALRDLNEELKSEIEERRRAEEALRVSENRYRELMENAHMIAVILDTEGCITFCNDYLLGLTGWSRDEVVGRSWFDIFIPAGDRRRMCDFFSSSLAAGSVPLHYENPIVTRSGEQRTINWDNSILKTADGDIAGIASLGRDVTAHRNLEQQLRHSQKMEAIGQLAGGVAHDFNNLLTVIMGNCDLIKIKTDENDRSRKYVDQILAVAGKAARLTQGLLAFSRKQILSVRTVDLNDCVRHVEALLSRTIGEDIEFSVSLSADPLPVSVDRDQIEQVLVNIATNARDAMPGGGKLSIETCAAAVDAPAAGLQGIEKPGPYALIRVSDTGVGMDEETRQKIFEPFFTTKEVGKGTGLGLAMVFGTIQQHGGYIEVLSEPGKGSLFCVCLPLVDAAPEREQPPREERLPGGTETLLVVEDNDEVRKTAAAILESYGYRVLEAADGEEALAVFSENRDAIRLVILDVVMPKMNGKEVYDALRKVRPDLPAIFTSGYAADVISRKIVAEEGLNLLQKPVTPAEFLQKVRAVLDGA